MESKDSVYAYQFKVLREFECIDTKTKLICTFDEGDLLYCINIFASPKSEVVYNLMSPEIKKEITITASAASDILSSTGKGTVIFRRYDENYVPAGKSKYVDLPLLERNYVLKSNKTCNAVVHFEAEATDGTIIKFFEKDLLYIVDKYIDDNTGQHVFILFSKDVNKTIVLIGPIYGKLII